MQLKPGSRWVSGVCETEVVVVRPPQQEVEFTCGGAPMKPRDNAAATSTSALQADADVGTMLGKRYVDEAPGLEVLCTKSGSGTLAVDGIELEVKAARPLPASD